MTLTSNNGPGQDDSHSVYGVASLADACGTYAMTITSGGIVAGPTASSRPEIVRTCMDHTVYTSFARDNALDAIGKFCTSGITLPAAAQPVSHQYTYTNVIINTVMSWSASGQTSCAGFSTSQVSQSDCVQYFTDAVDMCKFNFLTIHHPISVAVLIPGAGDTDNGYTKYGSKPLKCSSPIGCIDFSIYGNSEN